MTENGPHEPEPTGVDPETIEKNGARSGMASYDRH